MRGGKITKIVLLVLLFQVFLFCGWDINLVNAKLVDTVLNLCTLKCVLLLVQL